MNGPDLEMLEGYFRLMNTNGAAQVYHAALDAGVLSAMADGPRSSDEIATACELSSRPVALLLDAIVAIGVVWREDASYRLTPVAQMLLGSEYRELGNPYWRHLPAFLRTGEPLKKMDDVERSEEFYQAQAAILGWMLTPAATRAAEILHLRAQQQPDSRGPTARDGSPHLHPPTNERALDILDVGAGSAIWSLSLAALHSQSTVTAVDWPAVLEVAAETADVLGLSDRLTTIAGNCHDVALPQSAFDMAIVANLTHLQTPEQNSSLFQKVHAALKPGGELVIIDALPGSPAGDIPFALYHLGLALRTEHGRVYSPKQLQAMLSEQQFTAGETIPLDAPPHMVGMFIARKWNTSPDLFEH